MYEYRNRKWQIHIDRAYHQNEPLGILPLMPKVMSMAQQAMEGHRGYELIKLHKVLGVADQSGRPTHEIVSLQI